MRAIAVLAVAGCTLNPFGYNCKTDSQCGPNGTCVSGSCAVPSDCPSGFRFDSSAKGGNHSGECTSVENDLSTPGDLEIIINDMAEPSPPDMVIVLKAKGASCNNDSECVSNHCADGYCCDQACNGQCQACDGTPGTCTVVSGIPHGNRTACTGGTGVCASKCDGTSLSCMFPDATVTCGTQTCGGAPATVTFGATCNAAGSCVPTGGTMSMMCPAPANGVATCNGVNCDYACNAPYVKLGTGCGAVFQPETSNTPGNLAAIWGTSATNIYVGGQDRSGSPYKPVMLNRLIDGTWNNNTVSGFGVSSIWGDSASNIYYVAGTSGAIYHSATGVGGFSLDDNTGSIFDNWIAVWGSGLNSDVWEVGQNTSSSPTARIRRHSNGGWADETSGITGTVAFKGVWGGSDSDIYSITDDGRILHSSGNGTWGSPQQFIDGVTAQPLSGIWGTDSSHIYAVGNMGLTLFSTGNGHWTAQTSGTTVDLKGIWGSGPADIYVVGKTGTILHSTGDGKWAPQTSNVTTDLNAVWGSGATNVYAVGSGGTITHFH